jgi:hypothetical protein
LPASVDVHDPDLGLDSLTADVRDPTPIRRQGEFGFERRGARQVLPATAVDTDDEDLPSRDERARCLACAGERDKQCEYGDEPSHAPNGRAGL